MTSHTRLACRVLTAAGAQFLVVHDHIEEPLEVVLLRGKRLADFGNQQLDVVAETELHAGEGDTRANLRNQTEFIPTESQLAEHPRHRAAARSLGHEVGDRVQSDVEEPFAQTVKRVQTADHAVPFDDTHALVEQRQPDAGGEAGHAGANNDRVVHGREHALAGS